jgi:hypothetical protein
MFTLPLPLPLPLPQVGWYLRNAQTRALSHPLPVMRAREVDRWAQSPEFKGLLVRNSRHRVQQQVAGNGGAAAAPGSGGGSPSASRDGGMGI